MRSSAYEQLSIVLADQQADLEDVRRQQRELQRKMNELEAEEISLIVGIRNTREILSNLKGDD